MSRPTEEDPPPDSTDLEGWRRAISEGHFKRYRLEAIVAAIQDLGPLTDKAVLNPLAKHLSDSLLYILRGLVSTNHPNRGDDIIDRTADKIIDAVLKPQSADGKALRVAFAPRVKFRLKDALKTDTAAVGNQERHEIEVRTERATQRGADGAAHVLRGRDEASSELDEKIDVEAILEQVSHGQKRLAFRLYMDGIPFKSRKSASIAKALGISEKTAREWVKEVQALLSSAPAVQELLKSKTRGSIYEHPK